MFIETTLLMVWTWGIGGFCGNLLDLQAIQVSTAIPGPVGPSVQNWDTLNHVPPRGASCGK